MPIGATVHGRSRVHTIKADTAVASSRGNKNVYNAPNVTSKDYNDDNDFMSMPPRHPPLI